MQKKTLPTATDLLSSVPSVWIIVLNWNGYKDTLACIESLETLNYPNATLLIVDNGSTDDSVRYITSARPDLSIMQTGCNLGFGAGNNIGIKRALESGADYVWILNNDTLATPNSLSQMIDTAEETPLIGAVGSVLYRSEEMNDIQAWGGGRVLPWLGISKECHSELDAQNLDYITGASILLKSEAIKDIGTFDEHFFMYWEDTDLGIRLREAEWQLAVAGKSAIIHKHAASLGKGNPKLIAYYNASARYFFSKHSAVPLIPILIGTCGRFIKRLKVGDFRGAMSIFRQPE